MLPSNTSEAKRSPMAWAKRIASLWHQRSNGLSLLIKWNICILYSTIKLTYTLQFVNFLKLSIARLGFKVINSVASASPLAPRAKRVVYFARAKQALPLDRSKWVHPFSTSQTTCSLPDTSVASDSFGTSEAKRSQLSLPSIFVHFTVKKLLHCSSLTFYNTRSKTWGNS